MSLLGICQWLEHSALGMGIRDSDWIFYFIESLHVFGIILMVSTVAMVDLRLLGIGILRRRWPGSFCRGPGPASRSSS
jgi:hypothetical protein